MTLKEYKNSWYKKNRHRLLEGMRRYYLSHRKELAEYQKQYRKKNARKIAKRDAEYYKKNKVKIRRKFAKYAATHKKQIQAANARYRFANKERLKRYFKKYGKENNLYINERSRKRFQKHPQLRLLHNLRVLASSLIKETSFRKPAVTKKLFGCSWENFKKHIEKQFTSHMSWSNYGKYWELDHRIPVAYYVSKNRNPWKSFHYTNLSPLESVKNREKGSLYKGKIWKITNDPIPQLQTPR